MKKKSAFGIDYYPTDTKQTEKPELDPKTRYDLLLYDFIANDFLKHPYTYVIRSCKLRNLENDSFVDYCIVVTSKLYTISAIKTKIDSLPDNNNFIPAIYRSAISSKKCEPIEHPGEITSKMLYELFANEKTK